INRGGKAMIAKPLCAGDEAPVKCATQVSDIFFQVGPFRKQYIQVFANSSKRVSCAATSIKLYFVPAKIHSYAVAHNFGLGRAIKRFEKLFYTETPRIEIFW